VNLPSESIVRANGVDLCVGTFGDAGDPAILLIMGSSASMDWWEDDFCERLAAGSRFVVRYDHRDTGRSVSHEAGAPAYTGRDLIEDAVGVLDALRLTSAHLVGMSMGGAIAQVVALDYPDRVASLTLISTSPSGGDPDLPEMSAETGAEFAAVASPDWSDRAAVIDYQLQLARVCASRSSPFDEEELRRLAGRVLDRTSNVEASMTNHDFLKGADPWRERLRDLDVPTLVIHGTEDPVLPYGHALALAREIRGAELLPLERTGHELPRRVWELVVPAILEHTRER
jgi:pimeloyl-ACP methyl ester carboxylesterase